DQLSDYRRGFLLGKVAGQYGAALASGTATAKLLGKLRGQKALEKTARPTRWRFCFPAGTSILTPEGHRPIDDVRENDSVCAWDFDSQTLVCQRVAATFTSFARELVRLTLDDGTSIESTANHPFWVPDVGWQAAHLLQPGTKLFGADGRRQLVVA